MRARGAPPSLVLDIAVWAVPAGIIGARIYHVITSPADYFGANGDPLEALQIWKGGLGVWGAVAGGAVGAWLGARQLGIPLTVAADALAPGLPLAQAIGRLGNWFNNELYGGPTTLPWGLEVYRMDAAGQPTLVDGQPVLLPGLYQPTFLYELLWNLGVALMVYLADRRWKFGKGRAFALYVMGYTAGRFWIEMLRTDEATLIAGIRLNVFTSAIVFLGALIYFLRVHGSRQYLVPILPAAPPSTPAGDISRVDVSSRTAASAVPTGYRVVNEEQYEAYRQTGAIPDEDGPGELLDDFADDEPDDEPDGDTDRDAGDDERDRADRDGDAADDDAGDAPARDAPARDDNDASATPAKDR